MSTPTSVGLRVDPTRRFYRNGDGTDREGDPTDLVTTDRLIESDVSGGGEPIDPKECRTV